MSCVMYWLFDENCVCPWRHGYIGVTINLRNRLKWHRGNRGKFKYQVLFRGSEQECFALEAKMRSEAFIGWNLAYGGEGGSRQPRSLETRHKMREAALRRFADPNERLKMSKVQKGREISAEWRANIAAARRGTTASEVTRAKMSAVRKGRPWPKSVEHRAKLSAAKLGKLNSAVAESNRRRKGEKHAPQSAEHRARISAAKLGKKLGPRTGVVVS